jgi:ABC-type sugar transport system ATPase subunit
VSIKKGSKQATKQPRLLRGRAKKRYRKGIERVCRFLVHGTRALKSRSSEFSGEGQDSAIEYEEHARNAISSLDVSVQAQVLNLLKELQSEFNLTYIFISHDLSVVKFMSDRIMVMNKGCIEELGPADRIYDAPDREYTKQFVESNSTWRENLRYNRLAIGFKILPCE